MSIQDLQDLADELDRWKAHAEALEAAIKVYTSDLHLCSRRPCSCGAYSSLRAALTGPGEPRAVVTDAGPLRELVGQMMDEHGWTLEEAAARIAADLRVAGPGEPEPTPNRDYWSSSAAWRHQPTPSTADLDRADHDGKGKGC